MIARWARLITVLCLAVAGARCAVPTPQAPADERAVRKYLNESSPLILPEGSTVTSFEIMTLTPDSESVTPRDLSQALESNRADVDAVTQELFKLPARPTAPSAAPAPLQQQFADLAQRELDMSGKLATIDRSLIVDSPSSWPQRIDIIRERLRVDAQVKGKDGAPDKIVKHDLSLTLSRVDRGDGLSLPGDWVVSDARDLTGGPAKNSGSPAPVGALASLVSMLGKTRNAPAALSAPASMTVDDANEVRLTAGPMDGLQSTVQAVMPRLEATVIGQGFTITAMTPERIPVAMNGPSAWRWQVTPRDGGPMHVHVSLLMVAVLNGVETSYLVRSFDQAVDVHMTAAHWTRAFLSEYWQWIVVVLAMPFLLWRWIRRRVVASR